MKVLICSDTHRKNDNYMKVVEAEGPLDLMIHCGDSEGSEYLLEQVAGCPVKLVAGNNDYFSDLPGEMVFELGGKKVWLTHGHHYFIYLNTAYLVEEAISRGVHAVMYGHTHMPVVEEAGVLCINPGSLSYPRQYGRKPSYIILNIDEQGEWDLQIKYLP